LAAGGREDKDMKLGGNLDSEIDVLGRLIEKRSVQSLFSSFCREIMQFSNQISMEFTRFEISFYSVDEMLLKVSPYSELFVVSIGENTYLDVRVLDREGFVRALDFSLKHYLDSLSETYK
jgi:hypothetical protein